MAAAQESGKKVIGVDIDQSRESPTVITSAMKGLTPSVYDCISNYYANDFPGGQTKVYDASNDGVGLPMETSKFENFTQVDYTQIFWELQTGNVPRMDTLDKDGSPKVVPVRISRVVEIN
jgi:basic membrane protein A